MPSPLRIGIAGLGTVGAAVIKLLDRQAETLARRTGRQIVIRGVSALDRAKDRGIDLTRYA
ncbi:MAG TPA: homoserine dehydrogenase, partial [Methylocella sp.]|nr:homoserine dehydrogenase [Methylocella sp.]